MTILLLPFISMFCVYVVVIANLPWKISKLLAENGIVYIWNDVIYIRINIFNPVKKEHVFRSTVNIKPFSCESCLSFWISIIFLLTSHFNWFDSMILSGATSYITTVLKRFI